MKIVCFIDNLDSGGAQRQMCILAALLKKAGFEVEVLTYFPHDFFAYLLREAGVPWRVIQWTNKLNRVFAVRKALRDAKPDAVIAYLETPSLMAEWAAWPDRPFKLIVSERNTTLKPGLKDRVYYNFHRLADAVVPNSHSQQKVLEHNAPYLRDKIHTIINCVNLDKYKPADVICRNDPLRIIVLGRLEPQKNALGLAQAAAIVSRNKPGVRITIHWYGRRSNGNHIFEDLKSLIERDSLQNLFVLSDPVQDVVSLYHQADAVCMPSLYEGCSNVIAEAMACGKPILAGRVCDNPLLVKEMQNGLLFDPHDPQDMADALIRFSELPAGAMTAMGTCSRKMAEDLFSPERFISSYRNLIKKLVN